MGNKPQFTNMRPKFIICVSNGMKEDEEVEREQEFRDEFKRTALSTSPDSLHTLESAVSSIRCQKGKHG